MIYLQLFLSFLQVGMFSVGGGYAAMPLIQSQVVEQHGWLTMQEFTELKNHIWSQVYQEYLAVRK